jgi:chromosome segregation ATPase
MYFVAGLLVAGLVMMLILPAFWRRAVRLAERRTRLQQPLSVSEAIAERDQLRAEHSVAQRRLERRIETLQTDLATERAALGREIKRSALDEEKAAIAREASLLREELAATEAELGASRVALHDLSAQTDRAAAEIAIRRQMALKAETRADEQRAAVAALETRAAGLEARLADQAQAFKVKLDALEAGRAREAREASEKLADLTAMDTALGEKDRLNRELADRLARVEEIGRDLAKSPPKPEGDRELREAIIKLGADVLRLTGHEEEAPSVVTKLNAPPKREAFAPSQSGEKNTDGATLHRRARSTSPAP